MGNLRRMLSRAMPLSPWDDGKKDREWSMTKRRQRRAEQRETEAEAQVGAAQLATCRHGIPTTDIDAANCAFYEDPEHLMIAVGECRHSCNGSPCGSEACSWVCHHPAQRGRAG